MKSPILFLSLVFVSGVLFAQQETKDSLHLQTYKKNEVKLNMLELLIMPAIGITYEHYINSTSSYGVYSFINFGLDEGYRSEKIELAPFYRIYFQRQNKLDNKGLYTEVFTGLSFGETEVYDYNSDNRYYSEWYTQEYLGIALGVSVGYKFINQNDYVFELYVGAGRFINEQEIQAYPRIGISIGKRF